MFGMYERERLLYMPVCVFLLHMVIVLIFPSFVNSNLQESYILHDEAVQVLTVRNNTDILLKISDNLFPERLLHLGTQPEINSGSEMRKRRDVLPASNDKLNIMVKNGSAHKINVIRITGLRVETSEKSVSYNKKSVPEFLEDTKATLRLFGSGFTNETIITFAIGTCQGTSGKEFHILVNEYSNHTALVEIIVPKASEYDYRICAKNDDNIMMDQEIKDWLAIRSNTVLIPLWFTIIIIIVCLVFSSLFSGLNLGLMALDKTELKILITTGNEKEREYAKKIQPVRDHGNYLLCSILLGNVLVNSTNAILMGSITSGLIAVVSSTILIVIFGEIMPQAICSRHGLAVGANTILLTKFLMILTFPLAYPISKVLDWILGEEIGNVYNRERLKELVRVTTDANDLDKDEVNIISGALDMRKKTVAEVMTRIEDVFMLSYDAILDCETVTEIMKSGFSRIPVYEGNRSNVQKLLLIKDLALIDPDDNTPLRTLCEFYQNYCYFVFEDVTLAAVFKQFKTGQQGHLAFVRRINNEREGDPFCETIGLITMEDVIEELIQAEIMDETDICADNESHATTKPKAQVGRKQDFTVFAQRNQRVRISPQMTLASFQYLSTCVDAFRTPESISETILHRLLSQDVIYNIKCKGKDKNDASLVIYQQGKLADYFVLILEGRVEVTIGQEKLTFECGPFTFFGSEALSQNINVVETSEDIRGSLQSLNLNEMVKHTFYPDYSVKAIKDVFYIAIKRNLYLAAKRATLMERSQKVDEHGNNEPIDDEVKIFLSSLDEDYKSISANPSNIKKLSTSKSVSPTKMSVEEATINQADESVKLDTNDQNHVTSQPQNQTVQFEYGQREVKNMEADQSTQHI